MKLRINATLRAALIAAITAMGFTLTQAQAADEVVLTTTFSLSGTGSDQWTLTGTAGTDYDLTTTKDALIKLSDSSALGNKNTGGVGTSQLNPNTNVQNSSGWQLTFSVTNNGTESVEVNSMTINSFLFSSSGSYQSAATTRVFMLTMGGGDQSVAKEVTITGNSSNNPESGVIKFDFTSAVTLAQNESKTFTVKFDKSTQTDGCFVGITSVILNHAIVTPSSTWQGTESNNNWTTSEGAWNPDFADGNEVVFGTGGQYKTVELSAAVNTAKVTVEDNYTIDIKTGGSMSVGTDGIVISEGKTLSIANESGASHAVGAVSGAGDLALTAGTFSIGDFGSTGKLVVNGATLELGNSRHTIGTLEIGDGGVVNATGADNANGCVSGDINIKAGGTFKLTGHHDGFGWGNSATKSISLTGDSTEKRAELQLQQGTTNSATMKTNLKLMGHALISTTASGFNTYGCSIYAENTDNTIDKMQLRSDATIEVKASGDLSVGDMIIGSDGNHNLTKTGEGTLTFTGVANMNSLTLNGGSVSFQGATSIAGNLTMVAGATVTNSATLTFNNSGTIKIAQGGFSNSGTVNFSSSNVFDLSLLTDNEGVYTLFTGTAVDLSKYSFTASNITGVDTIGKVWTFNSNGTISYTAATQKVWTGDEYGMGDWNYTDPNWSGEAFAANEEALFNINAAATVTVAVEAASIEVAENCNVMIGAGEDGSLSSPALSVGAGAELITSVSIDGLEGFTVADGATWSIYADQTLGAGENHGTIQVVDGVTVSLTNADNAKALLLGIEGNGNISLGKSVTIDGSSATQATGALIIKDSTLTIGGGDTHTASIGSFSAIQLDNATINFNNQNDTFHNLEVGEGKTGQINSTDMGAAGTYALVLDGTSTINGTLTIQNEWNAQFNIEKLAGAGTLNIKGKNGSEDSSQEAAYTVGSVEDGFTGSVNIINAKAKVKLTDGTKLGGMEIGPGSLLVDTGDTASIGNLKVRDNRDATITVNGALNVTQLVTIGALKTLSINSTQDGGAKTLTTTTLGFDNVDAKISLQGVKLVVNGAATAGTIDPHNTNRGLMTVGSGASLELNGGVQWNTSDSKCADLVIENGGAVSVTSGEGNKFRNITINSSGGAITFSNSTNTVASLSVAAPAQGATTSVTIASDATLTVNGGSLSNAITNNGTLVFGGDITASGLTVNKGSSGLIDVNDKTDSGNGFETTSGDYITIVTNGTGATLTPAGHKVTQDSVEYTIQEDGTAVTAGGTTEYSTYYQTQGTVTTSAISDYATAHSGFFAAASVSGTGVLDVNSAVAFITADGGEVVFHEGGETGGLIVSDNAKVSGLTDYSIMVIAAGKTATLKEGITTDNVVFSGTDGAQVTNTNAGEGAQDITYSIGETAAQVTADTMTVGGTEEVEVHNSLVVGEIINNNTDGLILYGNVADGVTLTAAGGSIVLAGQTSNTVSVVDLNIAPNKSVMVDNALEEGYITVNGVLRGGEGTLLANLTLVGGSTLDVNGGDTNALTLGSTLTFDFTQGGLVNLDDATIAALNDLGTGENLDLIVCADPGLDPLSYGGNYDGLWYNDLFNRVDGLLGDYQVFANETGFGLTKTSMVPEPTTGTLSLLALMALAARRRRK